MDTAIDGIMDELLLLTLLIVREDRGRGHLRFDYSLFSLQRESKALLFDGPQRLQATMHCCFLVRSRDMTDSMVVPPFSEHCQACQGRQMSPIKISPP